MTAEVYVIANVGRAGEAMHVMASRLVGFILGIKDVIYVEAPVRAHVADVTITGLTVD